MTPTSKIATPAVGDAVVLPAQAEPSSADEVNHRVANALQLLAATVSSEAREVEDPIARAVLAMTLRRIHAIAGVNRQLYQKRGIATVDLADYLIRLGVDLEDSFRGNGPARRIRVRAAMVAVPADHAVWMGILVSELVTNAWKHAYAPEASGVVDIRLSVRPHGYCLEVEDRGRGTERDSASESGLGSRLIAMMVTRVDGRIACEDAVPGTRYVLEVGLP